MILRHPHRSPPLQWPSFGLLGSSPFAFSLAWSALLYLRCPPRLSRFTRSLSLLRGHPLPCVARFTQALLIFLPRPQVAHSFSSARLFFAFLSSSPFFDTWAYPCASLFFALRCFYPLALYPPHLWPVPPPFLRSSNPDQPCSLPCSFGGRAFFRAPPIPAFSAHPPYRGRSPIVTCSCLAALQASRSVIPWRV